MPNPDPSASPPTGPPLYVSYHGETDGTGGAAAQHTANLDIIDAGGFVARNVLGPVTPPAEFEELRAVAFAPDGLLWVVSGASSTSQILRFQGTRGADGLHTFVDLVESITQLSTLSHPFDIAFAPDGQQWFVSNQDTNVVVGPLMVGAPPLATPPLASYLAAGYPGGGFCPGTFVASADTPKVTCQTHLVPAPQGLQCTFSGGQQNSVRGLAHDGTLLYVADEVAGQIKGYDAAGQLQWQSSGGSGGAAIQGPVHLLLVTGGLLVGSSGTGAIVFLPLPGDTDPVVVAQGIDQLSGIAMDAGGTVYFGSRKDQQVYSVPFAGAGAGVAGAGVRATGQPSTATAYGPPLPDAPEFVTLAPTASLGG